MAGESNQADHSVLLVEDDDETRLRLAQVIQAHDGLELAGSAASCAEARTLLERSAPDVFLTDLGLPDGDGIELIREVREQHPDTLIMVVTIFGDERHVIGSIECGASGYLLKDATHEEIAAGIRQLIAGGSPISAPIARYLLQRLQPAPRSDSAERPHLSARETEVLRLIAKGFSFPEIAELMGISAHTVTTYVRRMYRKLEVSSRGEAVYEAVNLGLVRLED